MLTQTKEARRELIKEELSEVARIVLYLAVSFSLIATFKALILFQLNINEFLNLYSVALIEALVFGKVVVIAQKLPIMSAWDNRPLIWSVICKSVIMTVFVNIASILEDAIFTHGSHHNVPPALHPVVYEIAHQTSLLAIFMILYAARGLDRKLGHGTILKLLFKK
jgi:hypothetical protein